MVKKSTARSPSQCAFENEFQLVRLSRDGLGSMPLRFWMLSIVVSLRWIPRFERAPTNRSLLHGWISLENPGNQLFSFRIDRVERNEVVNIC